MATIVKPKTEKWNDVVKEFSGHFIKYQICTFTNLMWQFIMNRKHDPKKVIFHPVDTLNGDSFKVGLVTDHKAGYADMGTEFLPEMDYRQCCEVCRQLNIKLFGIDEEEANKMIGKSMALPNAFKN